VSKGTGGYFFAIMISLLINTIRRHDNLLTLLNTQLEYRVIDEVIVMNNGLNTNIIDHPKLKIVNPSWDIGLRSRWILGALAKNNCLVVQDDDLIVSEDVVNTLYGHFLLDNDKTYGVYGRRLDPLGRYVTQQFYSGYVDIVLTRIACLNKRLIPFLLEAEQHILPSRYPTAQEWPGDDILLSYVSTSIYNKQPFAIPIAERNMVELPSEDGLHKEPGFIDKRQAIINLCREKLCHERIFNITPEA
jgi:hypothetical protein